MAHIAGSRGVSTVRLAQAGSLQSPPIPPPSVPSTMQASRDSQRLLSGLPKCGDSLVSSQSWEGSV